MAFFNKKKNEDPAQDESNATPEAEEGKVKSGQKRTKKKKSPLSQILHESVWETVQGDFRDNPTFTYADKSDKDEKGNPRNKYVGIVLDTKNIGGLDKKSRRDEAKGTMVECINSGRMKTYITEDMMDQNLIMFIPDAVTLTVMSEFSILEDAPYELALVGSDGNVALMGVPVTYNKIAEIAGNESQEEVAELFAGIDTGDDEDIPAVLDEDEDLTKPSDNVIAGLDDAPKNEPAGNDVDVESESEPEPVDDIDDIPELAEATDDIEPLPDEVQDDDLRSSSQAYATPPTDMNPGMASGMNPGMDVGAPVNPVEIAMQEPQVQEVENTVPPEWTNNALVRRFYSDELGLEISTEPFDVQFMNDNPPLQFDENRPNGWLNEQLNEMSRRANLEMHRVHQENIFTLRERYFRLLALACDRIRKDLDIQDMNNQYGQIMSSLREEFEDAKDNMQTQVNRKKVELEQQWKAKLQQVGMDAARAAQHQYRERYQKQHEEEIYNIENVVRAGIEADFHDSVHQLYDRRRDEAYVQLDINITEILSELSDQYVSSLAEEREYYRELRAEMDAFLEENRKADIVHTQTLAEELKQTERADQVLAEQTAKIRAMSEEHKQKRQDLLDEIAKIRSDNQAEIETLNREHEFRMGQMRSEIETLQGRLNEMMDKYANIDAQKTQEFESRMSELKEQVLSWEDKCDHMAEVHKKSNLTSLFFVISAVIASLCIGFLGGEFVNVSRQTKQEYQTIVNESKREETNRTVSDNISKNETKKSTEKSTEKTTNVSKNASSKTTTTKADTPSVDKK